MTAISKNVYIDKCNFVINTIIHITEQSFKVGNYPLSQRAGGQESGFTSYHVVGVQYTICVFLIHYALVHTSAIAYLDHPSLYKEVVVDAVRADTSRHVWQLF